ncbi:uncharacterized protein LOC128216264 [Mya arenaria]|uniref:uncharacterized protein LOC128216264 n=1 Tax=Mya arenaria TaxID=6604 RepID=UPI0022E12562|nr:uncharacterized protein LOC128216264 [Mya arenaria]
MREVPQYTFHKDPATKQLLASKSAIGKLTKKESTSAVEQQQQNHKTVQQQREQEIKEQQPLYAQALVQSKFRREPDIPMKTSADTSDCFGTSLALLPGGRLLLIDRDNTSVKMVDTNSNKLVSQIKLSSWPWDLCLLPGDKAAVTLPMEGDIQFVSTKGEVTLQGIIKVGVQCRGIDFCDDNLIVSFIAQGKVVLMDVNGTFRKSVDKDRNGTPLFHCPYFLTVTRDGRTPAIYVSDSDTSIITKLSISLEVLQTFKDPSLTEPYGLSIVGDNQLLVCWRESNNIVLLDTSTGKITQLLGKVEGIERPYSVANCKTQKRMFVTCSPKDRPELENYVQVFNME